jgi:hypothetical protein
MEVMLDSRIRGCLGFASGRCGDIESYYVASLHLRHGHTFVQQPTPATMQEQLMTLRLCELGDMSSLGVALLLEQLMSGCIHSTYIRPA